MALAGTLVFLRINGARPTLSENEAYDLTIAVAGGGLDDVHDIAKRLETAAV